MNSLVRLDVAASRLDEHGLSGEVIATDGPFGNLVTNISGEDFLKLGYGRGQNVHVTIGKTEMNIPFVRTFSDVALKKPLLYIDSRGHMALAVNQGSFAAVYGVKPPVKIFMSRPRSRSWYPLPDSFVESHPCAESAQGWGTRLQPWRPF